MKRLIALCIGAFVAGSSLAQAPYPARPITMVVGFAPGGGTDTASRIIAKKLGENMGQTVLVENKQGAGGNIPTDQVVKAAADGYTILLASVGSMAITPHLLPKPPYEPLRDLAPITMAVVFPNVLVLHPAVPAKTLAEFVALAKAKPGTVNYGSSGIGNAGHMAGELFRLHAKVDIVHVPYKGGGPALVDLISGQVQMMFSGVPQILPHLKSGRLKAVAVGHPTRIRSLPDVPPVADTLPGFNNTSWYGLLAPAGTPKAIVNRINAAMNKALENPEFGQRLLLQGVEPVTSTPDGMREMIRSELARWRKVMKEAGISVESAR